MEKLTATFWKNKYLDKNTGWDLGKCSKPLIDFFDSLTNKKIKILIPGCGNAYEAEYLHRNGFTNVYVADWAEQPLFNLKQRVPTFPSNHLLHVDFFTIKAEFDIIIEQTFFCAINPELRVDYVEKTASILHENGLVVGLMFDAELNKDKPPFGGTEAEYRSLFATHFDIKKMEKCLSSEGDRNKREFFVTFKKR